MNRRGFLGLLGAVPLAVSAPSIARAAAPSARVRTQDVDDLDLSSVLADSLTVYNEFGGGQYATFRWRGTEPRVGRRIRIVIAGEQIFVGRIVQWTHVIQALPWLSYWDVRAESDDYVAFRYDVQFDDRAAEQLMRRIRASGLGLPGAV